MKLITKDIEERLPPLGATDGLPYDEKIVQAKFFTPWGNWTWLAMEWDPTERPFFGLVVGLDTEFGYFSLDELESIEGPFGLKIERDIHFRPTKLVDLPECPQWCKETED